MRKLRLFVYVVFLTVFSISTYYGLVAAISDEDLDSIYTDSVWYDNTSDLTLDEIPEITDTCLSVLAPTINDPVAVARVIDEYIAQRAPTSPMRGFGRYIVEGSLRYGISPFLVTAIASNESTFATGGGVSGYPGGFNPFGRSASTDQPSFYFPVDGGPDRWYQWSSWRDSVDPSIDPSTESEQEYLRERYVDQEGITDLLVFAAYYLTGSKDTGGADGAGNRVSEYYSKLKDIYDALIERSGSAVTCSITSPGDNGNISPEGYAYPVGPLSRSSARPCGSIDECAHGGTAAIDLLRPGGTPVYAITDGVVYDQDVYRGVPGCFDLSLRSTTDEYHYWYGHLQNIRFQNNTRVSAGTLIAEVADDSLGPVCHGRNPGDDPASHLHIDRGSPRGQSGGRECCRDPGIIPLMGTLWERLPQ